MRVIGYGLPRVGDQDFADWVDSNLGGQVTHINNMEDPIPIMPGRAMGFAHPSGEVHITDGGTWENCPGESFSSLVFTLGCAGAAFLRGADQGAARCFSGQDNPSDLCIVGDVPNIFEGDESNHDGPYDGITMGC